MPRLSPIELDAAAERQVAVDLFNHVWTLLERSDRTPLEDDAMLHAAHASRHHWGRVGTPENWARGEWQVSRVYAVLGRAEPALHHALRCLALCQEHGIGDWDLAFAYEALARSSLVAADLAAARGFVEQARSAGAQIADADDRQHLLEELATIHVS
jgi:hypothetical protein